VRNFYELKIFVKTMNRSFKSAAASTMQKQKRILLCISVLRELINDDNECHKLGPRFTTIYMALLDQ
jgi:hypothetical protein